AQHLRESGRDPLIESRFLAGEATEEGRRIGADLRDGQRGVCLWGGEPVVTLPAHPGRGGRMQALALAAAGPLDGARDRWLLAAGTDGADGPGDSAGAIIDGDTLERGRRRGLDDRDALARADAGSYLDAVDALFRTGPTGTNVMDIVIGLAD
ncbi:MAG TPA: MOFRL family protein, partial [Gammaproteobacteria bacterium]|nr:MOFRL family protein [Gammaproteobacteria bacterium]